MHVLPSTVDSRIDCFKLLVLVSTVKAGIIDKQIHLCLGGSGIVTSVLFLTKVFLRPGTQVRHFGCNLNALDDFLCTILMPFFRKSSWGFSHLKLKFFPDEVPNAQLSYWTQVRTALKNHWTSVPPTTGYWYLTTCQCHSAQTPIKRVEKHQCAELCVMKTT